ncbi:MAG TPA: hypothetical protein VH477_06330 [Bryobacteraceae bacterium]|jgi:hypothetical protein
MALKFAAFNRRHRKNLYTAAALSVASALCVRAQNVEFKIGNFPVQVHGFGSQGFMLSDHNNYLTMKSNSGSFAFTDFGGNATVQFSDKFRFGAQIYDRNIGQLGRWRPVLDWATADYRFADWLGIRAGKVKTVFGLYNDTQDMEFLHTWALLPQSVYPLDLRSSSIAHNGVDLYGTVNLPRLGSFSYTGYAGSIPGGRYGGYSYGAASFGVLLKGMGGTMEGADLRWQTPITGLLAGASYMHQSVWSKGFLDSSGVLQSDNGRRNNRTQFYLQYVRDRFKIDAEYRRMVREALVFDRNEEILEDPVTDSRSAYISASYRVAKRLEFGAYYSCFYQDWRDTLSDPDDHIFDKAITARIDLTPHWDLKIEGHFMDGYAGADSFRGFYLQDNPQGLRPVTNLLILRGGFQF